MTYGILNVPKNAREAPSLADLSPYDPTQGKRFGRGFSAVRVGLASHGWQGWRTTLVRWFPPSQPFAALKFMLRKCHAKMCCRAECPRGDHLAPLGLSLRPCARHVRLPRFRSPAPLSYQNESLGIIKMIARDRPEVSEADASMLGGQFAILLP
jgi:hypothetical protein